MRNSSSREKVRIFQHFFWQERDGEGGKTLESNFVQPGGGCVRQALPSPSKPRPKITIPQSLETGRLEKAQPVTPLVMLCRPTTELLSRCCLLLPALGSRLRVGPQRPTLRRQTRRRWKERTTMRRGAIDGAAAAVGRNTATRQQQQCMAGLGCVGGETVPGGPPLVGPFRPRTR